MVGVPVNHRPRRARCSHCGDVVLIAERTNRTLWGMPFMRRVDPKNNITLEHADPGPDGETFDGVDDDCRRPPVG